MTRAVITDIEGTTSSLSFVKDVLFPYSRVRIGAFVRAHAARPDVATELRVARQIMGGEPTDDEVVAALERWIDEDRKITPLKTLQGLIWEEGFAKGEFVAHVYDDVVPRLDAWRARGLLLYVYSSGSVGAQKLFFAHTGYGDITPLFSGYFDTTVGGKREAQSYRHIAESIGLDPADVVFLSDIEAELDAARAAGMRTYWLVRDSRPDSGAAHPQVSRFDQIEP